MSTKTENIKFNVYLNDKSSGQTMAGMQKEARILRADIRKLEIGSQEWLEKTKALKRVNADMQKVNAKLRTQDGLMTRVANGYNKYFAMFVTGAAGLTGLIMGFRQLSDVIVDFEKKMTNVFTLLSKEQIKEFGADLENTAIELIKRGHDIETVTKSMFDAISAGVEVGKTAEFLDTAERLAVGGVTELSIATDGLTSVMNAYRLTQSEVNDAADAFFSAQKAGKTTVAELASNIGQIAPVAANLGISYQELLSAQAAMTKSGISTAEGTTYLKGALTSLIKPTAEASALFQKEFGHGLGATQVKARGFTTVLGELSQLMEKYPDEMAEAIPNVRGLTAITALAGDGFKEYSTILGSVQNDIGKTSSLSQAYELQQENTDSAIRRAKGNLVAMTLEMRDNLGPVIRALMSIVSNFSHLILKTSLYIKENAATFSVIAKIIGVVTGVWLAWKITVGLSNKLINTSILIQRLFTGEITKAAVQQKIITSFQALWNNLISIFTKRMTLSAIATKAVTAGQWLWNAALSANPIGIVVIAIGVLVGALVFLEKKFQIFSKAWTVISDAFKGISKEERKQIEASKKAAEDEKKIIEERKKAVQSMLVEYDKANKRHIEMMAAEGASEKELYIEQMKIYAKKHQMLQAYGDATIEDRQRVKEEMEELTYQFNKSEKEAAKTREIEKRKIAADAAEAAKKKREELNTELTKIEEDFNISKMSVSEKELYELDKKYDSIREKAKGNKVALKKIEDLYLLEVEALKVKKTVESEKAIYDTKKKYNLFTKEQLRQEELDALDQELKDKLISEEDYLTAKKAILKKYSDEEAKEQQLHDNAVFEARKLYNLVNGEELKQSELDALKEKYDLELLTLEEFKLAEKEILDRYKEEADAKAEESRQNKLTKFNEDIQAQMALVEAFSSAVSTIEDIDLTKSAQVQDKKLSKLKQNKAKELLAAGDNKEKVLAIEKKYELLETELSEETEAKKLGIQKKYADTKFAIRLAEIAADTAQAIVKALADLGPIAGPIAGVLIGIGGAAQAVKAKQERDKVKGLAHGGYVDVISDANNKAYHARFGGRATGGLVRKPTVFITSEESPEYVIPSWLRKDPVVANFENIIENKRVRGFADGGSTSIDVATQPDNELKNIIRANTQAIQYLIANGVEGVWEFDRFKKGYEEMNNIESNNILS